MKWFENQLVVTVRLRGPATTPASAATTLPEQRVHRMAGLIEPARQIVDGLCVGRKYARAHGQSASSSGTPPPTAYFSMDAYISSRFDDGAFVAHEGRPYHKACHAKAHGPRCAACEFALGRALFSPAAANGAIQPRAPDCQGLRA